MKSKITGGPTEYLFTANVLSKYPVKYYKCVHTGFIQTEDPFWLPEAYSSAITSLDLGLVMRNTKLSNVTEKIIGENLNPNAVFLDYAGGYGMFTRMMRDKGYQFYHTDKYCENLYAKYFTIHDLSPAATFEMVTAFEVFEHLVDPLEEISQILNYSDKVLFSTELIPPQQLTSAEDWWYFSPETGQHVSFYSISALQHIAHTLQLHLYSNQANLHILSRTELDPLLFKELKNPFGYFPLRRWPAIKTKENSGFNTLRLLYKKVKRHLYESLHGKTVEERQSLLEQDFNYVRNLIRKNKD